MLQKSRFFPYGHYFIYKRLSSYIPSKKVLTDEVSPDLLVGASLGWGMTITTNDQLVDTLQESGLVKNERVAAAMRAMDRAWFAPQEERGKSSAPLPGEGRYALNKPTKLGFGATMSSPQIQAELLEVRCWPLLLLVIYVVIVAASPSPMHTHYLPIYHVHQAICQYIVSYIKSNPRHASINYLV